MALKEIELDMYQVISSRRDHTVTYPRCTGTKTFAWSAIYLSFAIAIACFAATGVLLNSPPSFTPADLELTSLFADAKIHEPNVAYRTSLSEASAEILAFVINLLVTTCADALGFVHATSLRWALYREGRLSNNTNQRLFRSARLSLPNRWFMNLMAGASLALCYASSSVLFLKMKTDHQHGTLVITCVSPVALCFLGIGLMGQVIVAMLCIRDARQLIPTWSSNPLANALACVQGEVHVERRPGRSMLSFSEMRAPAQACLPKTRQKALIHVPGMKPVLVTIWFLCLLPLVWAIIVYFVVQGLLHSSRQPDIGITFDDTSQFSGVDMALDRWYQQSETPHTSGGAQSIYAVLFLLAIQGLQTTALHCIELIVNMDRDEHVWRRAATSQGAVLDRDPLTSVLASWQAILLIVIKSGLHWLAGQANVLLVNFTIGGDGLDSIVPTDTSLNVLPEVYWVPVMQFHMSTARLIAYAAGAGLAALVVTALSFWPRGGPQPAAYGNLQTLSDLVDEWPDDAGRIWWGDKGAWDDGTRHAGTSTEKSLVGKIVLTARYA